MSATNGTSPVQELQEAKARLELARAQHDLAKLQRRTKALTESNLLWDWVSGYQDLLDRLSTTDGKLLLAPSTVTDRQYGAYWPHWRTWQERQLLQAQSRLLVETSDLAFGALAGLTSYVVGDGYTYRVSPRTGQDPPVELVEAVQWVVDEYCDRNDLASYEQEIFKRTRRDGECFLRDFVDEDGLTELRTVEPEQVMPHPTLPLEEGSFGILNRPGDVQGVLGYWVCYDGIPSDGEEVPTSEMTHIKVNVDRAIKRGMPDFVYDTYEGIKVAGRCVLNMVEGAAIQAAIAEIRQHETATASQVSDFVDDQADFTTPNAATGRSVNQQRVTPGTVRDIPKGMSYVPPPFSAGSQNWVAIVQASLRKVGVRWNAPEWLVSGDASNNNYASSLTAEAPFQRRCKRWQGYYKKRFKGNVERAIKSAALAGRIRAEGRTWTWDEIRRLLELQCEAPTLVERDTQKAAQENQTYISLGVKSRQTAAGELGLDWDQEEMNNEEYEEKHGQQGGGLPMPGEEGDEQGGEEEGGGDLASLLGESIVEDREGRFWLTEAREGLVKKVITNKAGRKQTVWVRPDDEKAQGRQKRAEPNKPQKTQKPPKLSVEQAHGRIEELLGTSFAEADFAENVKGLTAQLLQLTVKELDDLKKKLGISASGKKAEYAAKIAERALQGKKQKDPPEAPRTEPEQPRASRQPQADQAGHAGRVMAGLKAALPHLSDEELANLANDRERLLRALQEPKPKEAGDDEREPGRSEPGGGEPARGSSPQDGGDVAQTAGGSDGEGADRGRDTGAESAGAATARRVPADEGEVNRRLDRFERFFRGKNQHQLADWMGQLRDHIRAVGGQQAMDSLGADLGAGSGGQVQYGGVDTEESPHWASMGHFIESYLERSGIIALTGQGTDSSLPVVNSQTNKDPWGGGVPRPEDVSLADTPYEDKLQEAKDLPGLEASEDIEVVMGGPVTHVTPEVVAKMNEVYGEGKWLIKTYSPDNAFAGFGIFFPQRITSITQDARNTVWTAGAQLSQYGFRLGRDPKGKVFGLVHESGDVYQFGTEEYERTIDGDARHWAEQARAAADNEVGAMLPNGGKQFMVQPAFPVVGVTEQERAAGKTIVSGEGRVHVTTTKDGKVSVIPHSTWMKGDSLPIVFETEDSKAMAKAVEDALSKLPAHARSGQLYAPDVVKTADGYRVVELNASVEYGGSGYLSDNPFIIDSYVSHVTGREPAHVRFIRGLLSSRQKGERSQG